MLVFDLERGGDARAKVVVFDDGRCVVAWPTSVIVYDSEAAARAVHIEHMGGRGEGTRFRLSWADAETERGVLDAYQDDCEGVGLRLVRDDGGVDVPDYVQGEEARLRFALGYRSQSMHQYGFAYATVRGRALGGEEGEDA